MAKWPTHWRRVLRWERRVQTYSVVAPQAEHYTVGRDEEELGDFLNAAFLTAYHLKDYLQRDEQSASRVRDAGIERFITSSDPLSYCADLANGYKHLVLERPRRPSNPSELIPTVVVEMDGSEYTIARLGLTLDSGTQRIDPAELLTAAVLDWEYFMVDVAKVMREDWRGSDHDYLPPRRPPAPRVR